MQFTCEYKFMHALNQYSLPKKVKKKKKRNSLPTIFQLNLMNRVHTL